jgi:hypothetical protein
MRTSAFFPICSWRIFDSRFGLFPEWSSDRFERHNLSHAKPNDLFIFTHSICVSVLFVVRLRSVFRAGAVPGGSYSTTVGGSG